VVTNGDTKTVLEQYNVSTTHECQSINNGTEYTDHSLALVFSLSNDGCVPGDPSATGPSGYSKQAIRY